MSSKRVTGSPVSDINQYSREYGRGFLLPVALLLALDLLVVVPLAHHGRISLWTGVALVVLPKILLMPWAGARLLGLAERHYQRHSMSGVKNALLGCLLVSVLAVIVSAIESIQSMIYTRHEQSRVWVAPDPKFRFAFDQNQSAYYIEGEIDFGISRDFRAFLLQHPGGDKLVLHSQGGSIYEGRGLFKTIQDQQFSTHVDNICSSACTLAYLGGRTRTLSTDAKLGFHQYAVDYSNLQHTIPFYDPVKEQEHDILLMRKVGISEPFLAKAFQESHSDIWYPNKQELLEAGILKP